VKQTVTSLRISTTPSHFPQCKGNPVRLGERSFCLVTGRNDMLQV
jgi:hypothetical protein